MDLRRNRWGSWAGGTAVPEVVVMNAELLGTAMGKRLPGNVTTTDSASSRSIFLRLSFLRLSRSVLGSSSERGGPGLGGGARRCVWIQDWR